MKRRGRAVIIRFATAAGLGLVTSIAIAWIVSVLHADFSGTMTYTTFTSDQGGWSREAFGSTHVDVIRATWTQDDKEGSIELAQRHVLLPAIEAVNRSIGESKRPAGMNDWVIAVGWPWRCLWCHAQQAQFWHAPALAAGDPAIDITPEAPPPEKTFRVLPTRPLWLGLAGNVLIYGAVWFSLLSIPALRRSVRRRRGRCATCGYLLAGIDSTQCPECGASVTRVKSA